MSVIDCNYDLRKGDFHLQVNERIPATGITGVFGHSGAGKTTLLRCMAGLESCGSDSRPVHRRRVAYLFQTPQLFTHLSVRKNIEYAMQRAVQETLSLAEVSDFLDLQTLLDRRPDHLSGGEAQRVALARALCQAPTLILMDEPLAALDAERKNELLPYLERLHAESSVPIVYVSHQIDEVCRICDHLLVMDKGRIVAAGDLRSTITRLDVPQLTGAIAGAVLEATALRYDPEFDLTAFDVPGGTLLVPGQYAAQQKRLRISANDVSITLSEDRTSSILNVLPARIDAVESEGRATRLLRLVLGENVLLARITQRSWQQLELRVGANVFAQIKSVTVRL